MKFSEQFKRDLLYNQEYMTEDECLDFIFGALDDMLIAGDIDNSNDILGILSPEDLNTDNIVGILTITSNYKRYLPKRACFYTKSYLYLSKIHGDRASYILKNLE